MNVYPLQSTYVGMEWNTCVSKQGYIKIWPGPKRAEVRRQTCYNSSSSGGMKEIRCGQAGIRIGEGSFRGTAKGSLEIWLSQVLFAVAAAPTPNGTRKGEMI
jgi:hypothetical protein